LVCAVKQPGRDTAGNHFFRERLSLLNAFLWVQKSICAILSVCGRAPFQLVVPLERFVVFFHPAPRPAPRLFCKDWATEFTFPRQPPTIALLCFFLEMKDVKNLARQVPGVFYLRGRNCGGWWWALKDEISVGSPGQALWK